MRRIGSGMLVLFLAAAVSARDTPKPPASAADRLAALQQEQQEAETALHKAAAKLPDTLERSAKYDELWKVFDKGQAARFLGAVEIARAEPKSDLGFAALEWVLTIPWAYYLPAGKQALELMTEHHAANPKVGKVIAWVGAYRPRQGDSQAAATALIEAVAKKNPDRAARGQALLARAWEMKNRFTVAECNKAPQVERLAAETEKAFAAVLKDYADCPRLLREGGRRLGELAKEELYELRHLRVGKVAPEIEGEDLDGVKFKLSDYRGKVVVLDFWGDW
jgi:hypothetical protein